MGHSPATDAPPAECRRDFQLSRRSLQLFSSTPSPPLVQVKIFVSPSEARKIFGIFDVENDGVISYEQFCQIVFPDIDTEAFSEKEMNKVIMSLDNELIRTSVRRR